MADPCPNEELLSALAEGALDEASRSRLIAHTDGCSSCRETLGCLLAPDSDAAETTSLAPIQAPNEVSPFATTEGSGSLAPGSAPRVPPPAISEDDVTASRFPDGQALTPGLTIRGYLGGGGMGHVYRAFHAGFGTEVAVKVLQSTSLRSRSAKTRLFREARALAHLSPEHVVRVFDVGELPSGEPYVVMELLKGESLRDWLRPRMPLSEAAAIALFEQICTALAPAHTLGIVHRDLKPENMFVLPDGALRILDFGLSKLGDELLTEQDSSLTHSSAFLGTPLYVAPEQVKEAAQVDARADVWALGVMLYEALTGHTPFRRKTVGAVLAAVLSETPKRLDTESSPAGRVSAALADTVAQCLSLDPSLRPADAAAVRRALKHAKIAVPIAATASSPTADGALVAPPKPSKPKKSGLLRFALVPLAAAGIFGVYRVASVPQTTPALLPQLAAPGSSALTPPGPSIATLEVSALPLASSVVSMGTPSSVSSGRASAAPKGAPLKGASAPTVLAAVPTAAASSVTTAQPTATSETNREFGQRK
jgi:eukaryotic-like serine/threonine-protein kinase